MRHLNLELERLEQRIAPGACGAPSGSGGSKSHGSNNGSNHGSKGGGSKSHGSK